MRASFSNALVRAAKANPRVLLMTGDHGYALFDDFRRECPSQYINAGIAEQNMVGVAAGLAKVGFYPIVYGLSAFVPIRVLEQIKIDLCYEHLPALLIGDGAGVVYGQLGTSHQSTEDVAALRAVPNISIYSPADAIEMDWCFSEAVASKVTCYLRMGKADRGLVQPAAGPVGTAPIEILSSADSKVGFIATGSMVKTALGIAQALGNIAVWSVPRLKPLPSHELDRCLIGKEKLVVLEEHSVYGGLGSIVAERLSQIRNAPRLARIGIEDRFSELCGNYEFLIDWHGLSQEKIQKKIEKFLKNSEND
jgi:transketolase